MRPKARRRLVFYPLILTINIHMALAISQWTLAFSS